MRNPSDFYVQNGVDAFAIIGGELVKKETLATAKLFVEQNLGSEIPKEKWMILCELIVEANWSEEKFQRTVKWFLLNKCYPAWTIADWFQFNIKLYPFAWVREACRKSGQSEVEFIKTLEVYLVDGIRLYMQKDGTDLPLEKIK